MLEQQTKISQAPPAVSNSEHLVNEEYQHSAGLPGQSLPPQSCSQLGKH